MDTDDVDLECGSDIDTDFDDKTAAHLLHENNDSMTDKTEHITKSLVADNTPLTTNDTPQPTTSPEPSNSLITSKITTTSPPITTYPIPVVTTSSTMNIHPIPVVTTDT